MGKKQTTAPATPASGKNKGLERNCSPEKVKKKERKIAKKSSEGKSGGERRPSGVQHFASPRTGSQGTGQ